MFRPFPGPHGPGFYHPWWQVLIGWLVPLLFLLAIGALIVWVVLRMNERRHIGAVGGAWASIPGRPSDVALEQARLRYARGEMSREEFLQVSADLQGGSPVVRPEGLEPPTF